MSDSSVEEFMLGMASQLAEREDAVLCSDVRDKLFGPNEFSRRDLGALNIMRGRDNGLADYNTVSVLCPLPPPRQSVAPDPSGERDVFSNRRVCDVALRSARNR